MGVAGKVTVDLSVRSAGWTKGLSDAGKDVKQFVGGAEKAFKNLTGGGGASGFASQLNKSASAASDIATALRTGESASKLFGAAVNQLPIIGAFKQAGEAIRELFTGEQAARVEREKSATALQAMVTSYRQMALSAALLGKYGHERAKQQAENQTNDALSKVGIEHSDLNHSVMKREEEFANRRSISSEGSGILSALAVTPAEEAELQRDKMHLKELEPQKDLITRQGNQAQKDLQRENGEEQFQYLRANDEKVLEFKAKSDEKALKRSGEALKSAIHAIHADADAEVRAAEEAKRGIHLDGLSDTDKAARIESQNAKIDGIRKAEAETAAELEYEDGRKKAEIAAGNEEKLKEIKAAGAIERLKITDEQINTENEKHGKAGRSHLAEAASIEEEYRKQVVDAQKGHRDDESRRDDANDPQLAAQLDAANEERKGKLGLLGQKSGDETAKNQQAHLKEMRKLWEEVGKPAEKYKAKLADINEESEKYGDKKLKERELEKLDKTTLEEFKKQNPDHAPKVELYGRTLDYDYVPTGDKSTQLAQQQLDALKKANADAKTKAADAKPMYDYFRNLVAVVVQEITI